MYWLVVWTSLVTWCEAASKFPDGFQFGAATSAYQVEGAWNASDKSPSIWDVYVHENPSSIADHSNGDVACDSYHLWKKDIALARTLRLNFYRLYEKKFRDKYKGQVGLTDQHVWYEPKTPGQERNAQLARDLSELYTFPIFSDIGGWPPNIEFIIAKNSRAQKYSSSRLPAFTEEEINLVKGSADFFGVNYYTSRLVEEACHHGQILVWPFSGSRELNLVFSSDPTWQPCYDWLVSYPPGIRRLMKSLTERYGNIEIKIFENGFGTSDTSINDTMRVQYIKDHLEQILLSIREDGVNVTAYTAWSLIDNFEWRSGYKPRFGIVHVDYNDPKLKRTARASACYYADVIKKREV
ncbi:unnamed protein product [Pieris brassicae]|uniref:Myrosinase 1-like n=1 Tax=Pieris brassicae TaxID=7116 RepID=A0A9P0X9Z2_PIEBR|nr:unnamed protein product [Pieris brassicae]